MASKAVSSVISTRASPARTPRDVSASARRCAASPSRAGDPRLFARRAEQPRDAHVHHRREGDHGDADTEGVDLGADHQAPGRLEDDDPGADEDQHPLDRRSEVLRLFVAVGVVLVGRDVGAANRDQGDERRHEVDGGVDCLGQDRDRSGDRGSRKLQGDQERVREDGEERGALLRADHAGSPRPRRAAIARAARPRWLIACFSESESSAIVRSSSGPVSSGTNAGS